MSCWIDTSEHNTIKFIYFKNHDKSVYELKNNFHTHEFYCCD